MLFSKGYSNNYLVLSEVTVDGSFTVHDMGKPTLSYYIFVDQ